MKKVILILVLVAVFFVGCNKINNETNKSPKIMKGENEISYQIDDTEHEGHILDTGEIFARYDEVDKKDLKYEGLKDRQVYIECEDGSLKLEENNNTNTLANKKYKKILLGFSIESNALETYFFSYSDAKDMLKKVLPSDIKLEKTVKIEETNYMYQYYKSSKGKFVVAFQFGDYDEFILDSIEDFAFMIGISYFKKIE